MSDRLLPNWITAYLAYTAEQESPEEFHAWVAVSTIAGVLRRRVYFDMGYFILFPNLYVVLVSPPGMCKKSTAMRISRPIIGNVPGINFTVDSTTRERLAQDLAQSYADGQAAMTAYSSEFASLLTSSAMDMVTFLTDIYDCPNEWSHKTKHSGSATIKYPYLNLLAATTPDWLSRSMSLDTVGIGLTSRIVFVYSDEPRVRPPFPSLSKEQKELVGLLTEDLIRISTSSGQFKLDFDADEYYTKWYLHRRDEIKPDTRLTGYFERKPMHMLKVAMIIAAAKGYEQDVQDGVTVNIITLDTIKGAESLLGSIEDPMARVFTGVGRNPLAFDIEQSLVTILSRPEGITFAQLLDMYKHSVRKQELEEVLDTLRVTGHIRMTPTEHGPKYFPTGEEKSGDQA